MISRLLLAVDDSPAALAAARLAIELAAGWRATIRAVTVPADHVSAPRLGDPEEAIRRGTRSAEAVLGHVRTLATAARVPVEALLLSGTPARCVLEQARSWPADLIVIGRADPDEPGQPYVGGVTQHVLEFTAVPVLVVPHRTG
jgi:nucleotide-binding universal stress UspA family protein